VSAWQVIADRWGQRPLAAALTTAAQLALAGVPVAPSLAAALGLGRSLVESDPGLSGVFAPGGRLLGESDLLVQTRLGRTLERLAGVGAEDFYTGDTARALTARLSELGSALTAEDFRRHTTTVEPALVRTVFGHTITTMGANSQGFSLIQIMAGVEQIGLDDPLGGHAPLLAALFHESAVDRDAHLADPEAMDLPTSALIADEHIQQVVDRALGAGRSSASARPTATGDTAAVVAVDKRLAISLIQSVFHSFGAGVLEPLTGIICHNRGACFSSDPDSPNAVAPSKRPLHTLMPVIAMSGNRPGWIAGTMGGHAQPQIHAQLMLRHLAGCDPGSAVELPRFVTVSLDPGASEVYVEENFDAALRALRQAGEHIVRLPPHSEAVGHSNAIAVSGTGMIHAASDPRSDGKAIVL
jgi:gamma-glutamyltranspeptidase/glutathione hydrolase